MTVKTGADGENILIAVLILEAGGAVSLRSCEADDVVNSFNFGSDWRVTVNDLFLPHVRRPPACAPRPLIVAAGGWLGIFISAKSEDNGNHVRMIDLTKFEVANVVAKETIECFPWFIWLPDMDAGFGAGNPLVKIS